MFEISGLQCSIYNTFGNSLINYLYIRDAFSSSGPIPLRKASLIRQIFFWGSHKKHWQDVDQEPLFELNSHAPAF